MKRFERVKQIQNIISEGMYERDELILACILGIIAGQNMFLLGPPGTGKSLISRRLSGIFKNATYFEYLMQKFSTPEEVFGPVSIKKLKQDIYERQVKSYLPDADVVFLDEIWKASPAILNSLLTAINEKTFKNGNELINIPLKTLITASNECPEENQNLNAIYDRFSLRFYVGLVKDKDNFENLIKNTKKLPNINIPQNIQFTFEELAEWQQDIDEIEIKSSELSIISDIKKELQNLEIIISDRRWQRIAYMIKTSAYINERTMTDSSDLFILKYCLWNDPQHIETVENIVKKYLINNYTPRTPDIIKKINEAYSMFKEDISYVRTNYNMHTAIINNQRHLLFKFNGSNNSKNESEIENVYVPESIIGSSTSSPTYALDGSKLSYIAIWDENQHAVKIVNNERSQKYGIVPENKKGDPKQISKSDLKKHIAKYEELKSEVNNGIEEYDSESKNIFITPDFFKDSTTNSRGNTVPELMLEYENAISPYLNKQNIFSKVFSKIKGVKSND